MRKKKKNGMRPAELGVVLGCKEERNRGGEKKYLNQMKRAQAVEFKHEFEFKQPKAMLQHECNK
jgi:hypothetical protein